MKSVGNYRNLLHACGMAAGDASPALYVYRLLQQTGYGQLSGESTALLLQAQVAAQPAVTRFVYRDNPVVDALITRILSTEPDCITATESGAQLHQFWRVGQQSSGAALVDALTTVAAFFSIETDPAARQDSPLAFAMVFADSQLPALPCHRLLADLGGMDDYEFLQRLQKCFNIRTALDINDATPKSQREFGLYVGGSWYYLRLIAGTWFETDAVSDLDVSVLHDNAIAPMLGILHQTDSRIAFTDAQCDMKLLRDSVDRGQWQALCLMPPPDLRQLMHIADQGRSLPAHAVCFPPVVQAAVIAAALR